VICHVFSETTHAVASPQGFACVIVSVTQLYVFGFTHQNLSREGFEVTGGRNLPFRITLATGFYNSLYYRTSRNLGNGT